MWQQLTYVTLYSPACKNSIIIDFYTHYKTIITPFTSMLLKINMFLLFFAIDAKTNKVGNCIVQGNNQNSCITGLVMQTRTLVILLCYLGIIIILPFINVLRLTSPQNSRQAYKISKILLYNNTFTSEFITSWIASVFLSLSLTFSIDYIPWILYCILHT